MPSTTERVPTIHEGDNSTLIADAARLHLDRGMYAVDTTYGEGKWWKLWRPDEMVCHDLYKLDNVDFRKLPEADNTYDLAAFDPPYVAMGGRETSGLKGMQDAYGMKAAGRTPADVQGDIHEGLNQVYRVLKPKGIALVKCQSYISSGKLWLGEHRTLHSSLELGFEVVDYFLLINKGRPQPPGRPQQHADRRPSTLYVLRKPKARRA